VFTESSRRTPAQSNFDAMREKKNPIRHAALWLSCAIIWDFRHENRADRPVVERRTASLYGGTERVVSWLTEELVRQGHDVDAFASGDSRPRPAGSGCARGLRLKGIHNCLPYNFIMPRQGGGPAARIRCAAFPYRLFSLSPVPQHGAQTLTTLHGRQDLPELPDVYRRLSPYAAGLDLRTSAPAVPPVNWRARCITACRPACSRRQGTRRLSGLSGRICADKASAGHRDRPPAGMPLKVAAKATRGPGLFRHQGPPCWPKAPMWNFSARSMIAANSDFLGGARALLFPSAGPNRSAW